MAPKTIEFGERTHARLAESAAERGTTIGGCVGEFADAQRTHAEWEAIGQQTNDYLREHFGFDPTMQERAESEAVHAAIMSGLDAQFAARRGTRRVTGTETRGYLPDTTSLTALASSRRVSILFITTVPLSSCPSTCPSPAWTLRTGSGPVSLDTSGAFPPSSPLI